jgi:hypothetical protein
VAQDKPHVSVGDMLEEACLERNTSSEVETTCHLLRKNGMHDMICEIRRERGKT